MVYSVFVILYSSTNSLTIIICGFQVRSLAFDGTIVADWYVRHYLGFCLPPRRRLFALLLEFSLVRPTPERSEKPSIIVSWYLWRLSVFDLLSLPQILVSSLVDSFFCFFGAFHKPLDLIIEIFLNGVFRLRCLLVICLRIYGGGAILARIYYFSIVVGFKDEVRRNMLHFRLGLYTRFTLRMC